jgi:Tol biopolymer transport system component
VVYLAAPAQFKEACLNEEIWVMQADGQDPQRLLAGGDDFFGPPAWSPDAKHIAYVRGKFAFGMPWVRGQLEILDLATGQTGVLIATPALGSSVAWLPDGRLVYSLDESIPNQNDSNLWTLPLDGSGHAQGSSTRLTRGPGEAYLVGGSASGSKLAFFRRTIEPDVYVTDLEAHGARLTSPRRLTLDERADFPYSWTPDSKSVIFVSDRNGAYNIFKQGVDDPQPELLVGGHEDTIIARLSPDRKSILYLVTPPGGETPSGEVRLMRVPLAGGPPQKVLEEPGINNQQCAQSPSSLCLFSRFEPGRERFFAFDLEKGLGREIAKAEIHSEYPLDFNWSLSPNGQMLAMAKRATQNRPVIRVLPLGVGPEKIFPVPGWAGIGSLDWAADSRSVWATGYTNTGEKTLLNVALTGKVRRMLEEKTQTLGWAIPSPDGKHLALWKANGSSNVWMVENF